MNDIISTARAYLAGAGDAVEVALEFAAEVVRLAERRDALLALVANISQTTPLAEELQGWEGQRAALVAEVGTLRARVADLDRDRDERLAAAQQGTQHAEEQVRDLVARVIEIEGERDRAESHAARAEKVAAQAQAEVRSLTRALDIGDRARDAVLQAHADAAEMLVRVSAERDGFEAAARRNFDDWTDAVSESQALIGEIVTRDAALDACQRRIAEVMRERDEARAALAEACAEVRRHNAAVSVPLGYMTDERRIDAWESIAAGAPARPPCCAACGMPREPSAAGTPCARCGSGVIKVRLVEVTR